MKTTLKLLAFFFTVCSVAGAQVEPAATAGGASLNYALRYAQTGYISSGSLGNSQYAVASGNLGYINGSERLPFTADFGGGYDWKISGTSYATGLFENLWLSQGIVRRNWKVLLNDSVSYLPQTPTTGFSGIPGIGEPIGVPNPAPPSSQSILTLNTHVVNNVARGEYEHSLNYATSLSAAGSYDLLRYPDGNGLDTNDETGDAALAWRLNGRNLLSGTYVYSDFSYPGYNVTFETNTGLFGYQYKWSRNLSTNVSVGPQWISSSETSVVPPSTNVAASAAINYTLRFTSASLTYSRGTNGGSGYLLGAESDSVIGNFSREFGKNLTIGLTGGYQRTAGLNNNGVTSANYGGAEATWRIGRDIIVFANYTGTDQWSTSTLPANALNQLMQVVGFGIGYSPRETHFKQ
jgi:hypothetical protein